MYTLNEISIILVYKSYFFFFCSSQRKLTTAISWSHVFSWQTQLDHAQIPWVTEEINAELKVGKERPALSYATSALETFPLIIHYNFYIIHNFLHMQTMVLKLGSKSHDQ